MKCSKITFVKLCFENKMAINPDTISVDSGKVVVGYVKMKNNCKRTEKTQLLMISVLQKLNWVNQDRCNLIKRKEQVQFICHKLSGYDCHLSF